MTTIRTNADLEKALTEYVGGVIYEKVTHGTPIDEAVRDATEINDRHEWTFESDGGMGNAVRHSSVWLDDMALAIARARELIAESSR